MAGDAIASVARLAASLRALQRLPSRLAMRASGKLQELLAAQLRAGVGPNGEAWAPLKDGGRALADAPKFLSVSSDGTSITMTIRSPLGFHNAKRPMLPGDGQIPGAWAGALEQLVAAELDKVGK